MKLSKVESRALAREVHEIAVHLRAAVEGLKRLPVPAVENTKDPKDLGHLVPRLRGLGYELDGYGDDRGMNLVAAALDKLNVVPTTSPGIDLLSPGHGTVQTFYLFQTESTPMGATKLVAKFMERHAQVKVSVRSTPWGRNDAFTIEGPKWARQAFQKDPMWKRLQIALKDLYVPPGYSSDVEKGEKRAAKLLPKYLREFGIR